MGSIINDIVEDINIRPNKTKIVFRWILIVAVALIGLAFAFGQFKSSFFNRMDDFESKLQKQSLSIEQVKTELNTGFDDVNIRIQKIYNDGYDAFSKYQNFNKEQLLLILDYGQTNKDLLKRILDLNSTENIKKVENQLEQSKNNNLEFNKGNGTIVVEKIRPDLNSPNYMSLTYNIETNGDTIFYSRGTTIEFINNINKRQYKVGAITESLKYPNLYDVTYRNK